MLTMTEKRDAYLLTGSNLNDRESFLSFAENQIEEKAGTICRKSAIYETEPWGVSGQDWYLNQALHIKTTLTPMDLLKITKEIERDAGRKEKSNLKPRVLDIDILFYNDLVIESDELTIPHPRLDLRKFTLIPLQEIAPDLLHPVLKQTIDQLLETSADELEVRKLR